MRKERVMRLEQDRFTKFAQQLFSLLIFTEKFLSNYSTNESYAALQRIIKMCIQEFVCFLFLDILN
jgi:hypothetical protein